MLLDGYTVLRAIGSQPHVFPVIAIDAKKAACGLVGKQLKASSTDLAALVCIRDALGEESFTLLLDNMSDSFIKTLVNRFDKHHPELKASTAKWRRQHLDALARGIVEPVPKPEPVKKKRTPNKRPSAKKAKVAKKKQTAKKGRGAVQQTIAVSESGTGLFGTAMDALRKRR